jgi:hypothetical protein
MNEQDSFLELCRRHERMWAALDAIDAGRANLTSTKVRKLGVVGTKGRLIRGILSAEILIAQLALVGQG